MENQTLTCSICSCVIPEYTAHHSLKGAVDKECPALLCTECYREQARRSFLHDLKLQCEQARKVPSSPRAKPPRTALDQWKADLAYIHSRINFLESAVQHRRMVLEQERKAVDATKADIDHLQRSIRSLYTERIRIKYRLTSMVPVERARFLLCPECAFARDGVSRLGASQSDGPTHTSTLPENRACGWCVCM